LPVSATSATQSSQLCSKNWHGLAHAAPHERAGRLAQQALERRIGLEDARIDDRPVLTPDQVVEHEPVCHVLEQQPVTPPRWHGAARARLGIGSDTLYDL